MDPSSHERDRARLLAVGVAGALVIALARIGATGPLSAAAVWVACVVVLARASPRGLLSLECLYLGWLGLFHLGLVVPLALGLPADPFPEWLVGRDPSFALGLFTAATLAFTLGAVVLAPRPSSVKETIGPHGPLFLVGLALAVVGALVFWRGVLQIGLLSGTYAEYYDRPVGTDVRFFGLGIMLFPIGILVAAVGATASQLKLLGLAYACVVGPVFVAGFRGPVLAHTMALLAIWLRKDPRAALRTAAAVAVVALVLVPAIRVSRNADASVGAGARAAKPIEVFTEAGGSIRPLILTAERIESGREKLWWGRSYAMAAERLSLNFGWKPRMTSTLTPNQWATMHDHPWAFDNGGGIGFSGVAEPYLNFGRAGMVAFFVVLGMVLALGDRALGRNHYGAALIAASFGFVLWTVRNDSMDLARAAAITGVLVAGAWAVASVRRLPSA